MAELMPKWLIRQLSTFHGRRLPHRERLNKSKIKIDPHELPIRVCDNQVGMAGLQKPPKGFDNWEYRFWLPEEDERDNIPLTECRCCGMLFFQTEARRGHLNKNGCARKLVEAFELLLKDKRCIICDQITENRMWGIPICNNVCRNVWMEEIAKPQALECAFALVPDNV